MIIVVGAVYGDHGCRLFLREIAALLILRLESAGFKQNLERVAVAGVFASPSISLSKKLF